ncbi:MAG: DNA-binding domain-containing protein [Thermoanaerobaculia bacterium]
MSEHEEGVPSQTLARSEVASPGLARMQGWMQSVVTHPDGAEAGVESAEAGVHFDAGRLGLLVKTTGALTPLERLAIYQEMHLPRMVDALASDYPMLLSLVGREAFEELVAAYNRVHPSRSYTLNRLGDRFPEFLATHGAARGRQVRADLARLELAMTEVFDADETACVSSEEIAAIPPQAWSRARFQPIAALRLVSLETNAHALFSALRAGEAPVASRRKREHVLVFRRDYGVRRRALVPAAFALLQELVAGETLVGALETLTRSRRSIASDAVGTWMREWITDGLFARIQPG